MSHSRGVRRVWRASARRLVIVDSNRSSWPTLSSQHLAGSCRGAVSSVSIATRIAATGVRS